METTLHQQLKLSYAEDASSTEVKLGRFRIDAVRGEELIEVQCASLSAIRDKCQQLLQRHPLRVVKPIIMRTRITRLTKRDGAIESRRMSPKRGSVLELFDELIYFTRVFPHPNLTLEVPLVQVEQFRIPNPKKRRRSWHKDYTVADVKLESIQSTLQLREPEDLLELLAIDPRTSRFDGAHFNTADLAAAIDRPRWHAQQIAYVLRKTGAIEAKSRSRTGIQYRQAG